MESALTGLTVVSWLFATVQQARALTTTTPVRRDVYIAGWIGVAAYLAVVVITFRPGDMQIGTALAISSLAMVMTSLLAALRMPLTHLLVIVLPVATGCIALATILPASDAQRSLSSGLITHALLSALAYADLSLAGCQALVLFWQERTLRRHHTLKSLPGLPALMRMEELLFQLVWLGLALLSAAIVSGLLFLSDLFDQRVVHHTVLSISAWCVFAVLLWGRHVLGWRGRTAVRWTIVGFGLLALAYFGSKVVIEIILPASSG